MSPENCTGTFIVRYSGTIANYFALTIKDYSFKTGYRVKNYRIKKDASGNFYIYSHVKFNTLPELISYYRESPFPTLILQI